MVAKPKLTVREQWLEDFLEWPMIWLTVLLALLFLIPLLFPLSESWQRAFLVADMSIWAMFYVEFFLKLAVSSNFWATIRRNWWLIIILLSPLLAALRFVRLAQLISLTRLLRLQSIVKYQRKNVQELIYNVEYVFLILAIFTVVAAFLMWRMEVMSGGTITNYADALWWSVVTITTIGYGDVVPASAGGRILGSIMGVFGATLFTVLIARITAIYVQNEHMKQWKRQTRPRKRRKK